MIISRKQRVVLSLLITASLLIIQAAIVSGSPAHLPIIDSQRVEVLEQIGGPVTGAAPLGEHIVLVSEGAHFNIIDLSGRLPRVVRQFDLGFGTIVDFVQQGSLYYALTEQGVVVFAIEGDRQPVVLDSAPGSGQEIAVSGQIAAVAARNGGVRILHVTNSGEIVSSTLIPDIPYALDIAFSADGLLVFAAGGDTGLHVISVDLQGTSHLVTSYPQYASATSVTVSGNYLAIGMGNSIAIINAQNPAEAPTGMYTPLTQGQRIVIDGDYAFIADNGGLKVMWLAAPDRPIQIYGETGSSVHDIQVSQNIAYVADDDGLRILDVSNKYVPRELGRAAITGGLRGIAVGGSTAWAALGEAGVGVIDIANLAQPYLKQKLETGGFVSKVHLDNRGLVYAAAGDAGIAVIMPGEQRAAILSTLSLPGPAIDLEEHREILYVAAGDIGVIGVDIARPSVPVLVDILSAPAYGVTVEGRRLYIAGEESFTVADISTRFEIGHLARVKAPTMHIGMSGIYLYAVGENKITVYDARATADPSLMRTYTGLTEPAKIAATGDHLFVTGANSSGPELVHLSLQNPSLPIELDSTPSTGTAISINAVGPDIWVSRGHQGMRKYILSEGGALILRSEYATFSDAAELAQADGEILIGGRTGWAILSGAQANGSPRISYQYSGALDIRDIDRSGSRVAVAAGTNGAMLFAIGEDGTADLAATAATRGPANGVAVDQEFVYIADAQGLSIFDQQYLSPVSQVTTPAPANDITLQNGYAYLSLANGEVVAVELGSPTGGIIIRSSANTGRPVQLVRSPDGELFTLLDDQASMLRANNLNNILVRSPLALKNITQRAFVIRNQLWVGNGLTTDIYDFMPSEVGYLRYTDTLEVQSPADILAAGNTIFIAHGKGGLSQLIGKNENSLSGLPAYQMVIIDNILFTVGDEIIAWNIQPGTPELIARLPLSTSGQSIVARDSGTLLVGTEDSLLSIAWDGSRLKLLGQAGTGGSIRHIAYANDRAYLGLHQGGLLVVDTHDITAPQTLFSFTSPSGQFVHDLMVLDESTLLVSWEGGIDALDVSNAQATPSLSHTLESGGSNVFGFTVSRDQQNLAVLTLGEDGITLLDITQQQTPLWLANINTPGVSQSAEVINNTLYVADGLCGLRIYDLSEKEQPVELGYWQGGFASDLQVIDNHTVFLADSNQLVMLGFDPELPAALPPVPRSPSPIDSANEVTLTPTLMWEIVESGCNEFSYNLYFGTTSPLPLLGQIAEDTELQLSRLDPLRTYFWQVEVIDAQGDRSISPVWQFTTGSAQPSEGLKPGPPPFVEKALKDIIVPLAVLGAFLLAGVTGRIIWILQKGRKNQR